jgi:hypothetical protein
MNKNCSNFERAVYPQVYPQGDLRCQLRHARDLVRLIT